jgi:hypothetical protein
MRAGYGLRGSGRASFRVFEFPSSRAPKIFPSADGGASCMLARIELEKVSDIPL